MAGEIEDGFAFDFQVDSVHSGSISFGRFENEALCWERRSSFSHNRYLEEVEKCSKPGLVTEKKAYFEAHFRKKGLLGLNSPRCKNEKEYETGKDDILVKLDNNEAIDHMNDVTQYVSFEETGEIETSLSDPHVELASDPANDLNSIGEHVKVVYGEDVEVGSSPSVNTESVVEMKDSLCGGSANLDSCKLPDMVIDMSHADHENGEKSHRTPEDLQGSLPKFICPLEKIWDPEQVNQKKEKDPSEAMNIKPRLAPQERVEQRRRASINASKVVKKKPNEIVGVRSKAENISQAPKRYPMHEASNHKRESKEKGTEEFKRVVKKSTSRITCKPCPASDKISSRVHQSVKRGIPEVSAIKPRTIKDISRFSFRSDPAQSRKEFGMKLEDKLHAMEARKLQSQTMTQEKKVVENQQLRNSNFKTAPMSSLFRRASHEPSRNEAMICTSKPQKQLLKSRSPGIRVSENPPLSAKAGKELPTSRSVPLPTRTTDQPQASATSCHSTVTSESSASSHVRNSHRCPSQTGGITQVSKKKVQEKEKLSSYRRHKVPEVNQMYKGKVFDGRKQRRAGSGNMAVLVAS